MTRIDLAREAAFTLGAMQVVPAAREIVVDGKSQILQPRVMQVLVALAQREGEVVPRDELVATCWGGLAVSEDAINRCIAALRRLSELQDGRDFSIDTISRVGYRLTAPSSDPTKPDEPGEATESRNQVRSLPEKPSIAVVPFDNLSDDEEQAYFVDGVVEEIITALSRVRSFLVIARNSTFVYKGKPVSARQVSDELGVRYVLEGSVQRDGARIRLHAQLIDATTEAHIWADRYEGDLKDIFDLQDRITSSVVGAIQPSILSVEIQRARRKRPDSLDAYDCVLHAFPGVWALEKEANDAALIRLREAIDLEPSYPLALALAAWCEARRAVYNWTDDRDGARAEGLRLAERAGELRSDDPTVLAMLGAAHTVSGNLQLAKTLIERALALDPNSAWAWYRSGWLCVYLDKPEVAIEHFQKALRLSPFDPMNANTFAGIGAAHFVAKRYAEAVSWTQKSLLESPRLIWGYRLLVPAWVNLGQMVEAQRGVQMLLKEYPDLTVTAAVAAMVFPPETLERIANGLRKAGLPD